MLAQRLFKYLGGAVALSVGFVALAWLVWVPVAKEPGYVFVAAWGEPGSAPGRFHDPTGIAVTDTEVFVSDARNARIQVFDHDGNFKRQFTGEGSARGQLGRPMNLTIAGNELYVADYWNDRIQVFGVDGAPRRGIGGPGSGPGQFMAPGGVAIAPGGDLFVADFYNHRIQQLRADGGFIRQWGITGKAGIWAREFSYPTDVALGKDGTLYIADGYNDRIQVFSASGEFLRKWGGPLALNFSGPFKSWFATVTSIAIGPDGNLFVADFYNHRIQKFAPDGTFLTSLGEAGNGPGQFRYAIAVAIGDDGTVFAVDYGNNRIEKWRSIK